VPQHFFLFGKVLVMPLVGIARSLHLRLRWWCALVLALPFCTGCGSGVDVVAQSAAEKELTEIAKAYSDAHAQLGHGPKDAEELKPFLKFFGDPDDLLVSPSDKQPYVVVWNANPSGGPTDYEGMFPILAYEKEGSGGRRAVTDFRGVTLIVPAEDFSKLKFVGRHKPATN
jgi:hypothetical protein